MKAAINGHVSIVRALFQAGADVDDADIYGVTLDFAIGAKRQLKQIEQIIFSNYFWLYKFKFQTKKVVCLKINSEHTTFLFFLFFMFYSKVLEKNNFALIAVIAILLQNFTLPLF